MFLSLLSNSSSSSCFFIHPHVQQLVLIPYLNSWANEKKYRDWRLESCDMEKYTSLRQVPKTAIEKVTRVFWTTCIFGPGISLRWKYNINIIMTYSSSNQHHYHIDNLLNYHSQPFPHLIPHFLYTERHVMGWCRMSPLYKHA